jgi:hypothetical protein
VCGISIFNSATKVTKPKIGVGTKNRLIFTKNGQKQAKQKGRSYPHGRLLPAKFDSHFNNLNIFALTGYWQFRKHLLISITRFL